MSDTKCLGAELNPPTEHEAPPPQKAKRACMVCEPCRAAEYVAATRQRCIVIQDSLLRTAGITVGKPRGFFSKAYLDRERKEEIKLRKFDPAADADSHDRRVVLLMEDAAQAKVVAAHLKKVAHVDIKPSNERFRFCSYCKNFHPVSHFHAKEKTCTRNATAKNSWSIDSRRSVITRAHPAIVVRYPRSVTFTSTNISDLRVSVQYEDGDIIAIPYHDDDDDDHESKHGARMGYTYQTYGRKLTIIPPSPVSSPSSSVSSSSSKDDDDEPISVKKLVLIIAWKDTQIKRVLTWKSRLTTMDEQEDGAETARSPSSSNITKDAVNDVDAEDNHITPSTPSSVATPSASRRNQLRIRGIDVSHGHGNGNGTKKQPQRQRRGRPPKDDHLQAVPHPPGDVASPNGSVLSIPSSPASPPSSILVTPLSSVASVASSAFSTSSVSSPMSQMDDTTYNEPDAEPIGLFALDTSLYDDQMMMAMVTMTHMLNRPPSSVPIMNGSAMAAYVAAATAMNGHAMAQLHDLSSSSSLPDSYMPLPPHITPLSTSSTPAAISHHRNSSTSLAPIDSPSFQRLSATTPHVGALPHLTPTNMNGMMTSLISPTSLHMAALLSGQTNLDSLTSPLPSPSSSLLAVNNNNSRGSASSTSSTTNLISPAHGMNGTPPMYGMGHHHHHNIHYRSASGDFLPSSSLTISAASSIDSSHSSLSSPSSLSSLSSSLLGDAAIAATAAAAVISPSHVVHSDKDTVDAASPWHHDNIPLLPSLPSLPSASSSSSSANVDGQQQSSKRARGHSSADGMPTILPIKPVPAAAVMGAASDMKSPLPPPSLPSSSSSSMGSAPPVMNKRKRPPPSDDRVGLHRTPPQTPRAAEPSSTPPSLPPLSPTASASSSPSIIPPLTPAVTKTTSKTPTAAAATATTSSVNVIGKTVSSPPSTPLSSSPSHALLSMYRLILIAMMLLSLFVYGMNRVSGMDLMMINICNASLLWLARHYHTIIIRHITWPAMITLMTLSYMMLRCYYGVSPASSSSSSSSDGAFASVLSSHSHGMMNGYDALPVWFHIMIIGVPLVTYIAMIWLCLYPSASSSTLQSSSSSGSLLSSPTAATGATSSSPSLSYPDLTSSTIPTIPDPYCN